MWCGDLPRHLDHRVAKSEAVEEFLRSFVERGGAEDYARCAVVVHPSDGRLHEARRDA